KHWLAHLVRPVSAIRTRACLLNSRIDRERRSACQSGNVQELPAGCGFLSQRPQKVNSVQRERLEQAESKYMRHVKGRRSLFSIDVLRILRHRLDHGTRGPCGDAAQRGTRIIQGRAEGVVGLEAEAQPGSGCDK